MGNTALESIQHVLRDCPETLELWRQLVSPQVWHRFRHMPWDQWLRWNLSSRDGSQGKEDWRIRFAIICWWAWRRRNSVVFEDKRISNSSILISAAAMVNSSNDAWERLGSMHGRKPLQNGNEEAWRPPPTGWVKLNTDGAFSPWTPGIASGGLLRDNQASFVKGFKFKGDGGDCLTAELWGCLHGLKIAWDLGFRQVILEVDSSDAVELISNLTPETHEDGGLIEEIKRMTEREWSVELHMVSRKANEAADLLAKASLSSLPGLQIISQADLALQRIIIQDND